MHLSEFFGYIETGHIQAVAEAIRVDSNMVNAGDEDGVTPLQWAAEHGQIEIARLLLSLGADVQARNDEKATAFFAAVFKDLNLARLLLEAGADIQTQNALGHTPLHELAWYGRVIESQFVIDNGASVDSRNTCGCTPLHLAADSGMANEVQFLIANGADVNSRCTCGHTPLHHAVSTNIEPHQIQWHLDTIETLIRSGADINAPDDEGQTPLELARRRSRYPEILALLVQPDVS